MGSGGRKEKVVPLLNKPGLTQHFLLASQQDVLLRKENKPQLWMAAILGTWKQAVSRKAWMMDIMHKVASQVLNVETQCNRLVTPGNVPPNSKVPYSTQSSRATSNREAGEDTVRSGRESNSAACSFRLKTYLAFLGIVWGF